MEPTVRKSCPCPCPAACRSSNSSREVFPVVDTTKSSGDRQDRITERACSRVMEKEQGTGWNGYSEKVPLRISSAEMPPFCMCLAASCNASSQFASRIRTGIPMLSSKDTVTSPCFLCWGSSCVPGSPRQPISSSMGIRYTRGSARDSRGFTALPIPEFCRNTTPGLPVAR